MGADLLVSKYLVILSLRTRAAVCPWVAYILVCVLDCLTVYDNTRAVS